MSYMSFGYIKMNDKIILNANEEKYKKLLDSGNFLPNSPTLMNAGNDLQQLSACFVLPLEDSMEGIFTTIKNAAIIHKSGGGTGFSFSRLRESNARVRSTNGVSSGPISFLKVFNAATDAVKQGGTRRGANMAILSVQHPQILEFISCKEDTTQLTNFNISVGITEDFMKAVRQDDDVQLISPQTGDVKQVINAREIFSLIVDRAHKTGEPGIVFLDRINEHNPTPHIGEIESTNPCGEQPLLPNEACNLGSINLANFFVDGAFDWDNLKATVRDSVDFLDDVINVSAFPLPEIDEMVKANRKIGLGVMGWADLLYLMELPYSSQEAVDLAEEIMEFIDYESKVRSMELAQEFGSFPNFVGSIYETGRLIRTNTKKDWTSLKKDIQEKGLRNATLSTIAPTGTISMIADTSGGVEPQFSLVYVKYVMDEDKLIYVNKHLKNKLIAEGIYSDELMEKIAEDGSLAHIEEIPQHIRDIFVTSHDIAPEWHIKMQAAFQKYCDNAVSKTINFKSDATKEEIQMAYELAYDTGCKGVTVYRDGSRQFQVLNVGKTINEEKVVTEKIAPRVRPEITKGITQRIETGCGHMYVTINSDNLGACEMFISMGKVGGCASAQLESQARLITLALRADINIDSIVKQLKGIRCPSPMWSKGKLVTSCSDAVAIALQKFSEIDSKLNIKNITLDKGISQIAPREDSQKVSQTCPDCGNVVFHEEGCLKCQSCGWSKC
ncbi:MAG: ribonucleotide-diphosphate reductase subunit alpha [Candidatus Cloacimonetes bacterium 4572_65]|nr:MAG: ribonucleotide-diphosphate reductase subunit alpha [Candidatus Cloacimonetes bacterium 4572_65]